eukprot:TRINITY_DN3792_c0_g1_i2.p1 TRINITY_DN3792_c0_g1~~TRINITY_DN3792_c0_g1_i2.p1  ORF type:complete len:249 (+),score=87.37 TRINITY_DN3792_c0_g1_i2:121-867(+)
MKKATRLLEENGITKDSNIDILLLPEMAFTGYHFDNREDIRELMESEEGPTFQWCKETSLRLGCFVAAGFPLLTKENGVEKWYNALCFVSPEGKLITNYAKHFLFETDKTWADAGSDFLTVKDEKLGTIGFGICMDINPKEFLDYSLYEFSNYYSEKNVDLIIMLCNWLDPNIPSSEDPTLQTMGYWFGRLKPLHRKNVSIAFCNRVGLEKGTLFVGASCVMNLKRPPAVIVNSIPWKQKEGVLVCEY